MIASRNLRHKIESETIIRARAPLRLGLAGGGTDVSPFCNMHGGYVLNATIDRYAYALIRKLSGKNILFIAADQKITEKEELNVPFESNGRLDLHKAVYKEMIEKYNNRKQVSLELTTFCDAPAGSGLGSSSTLVVVMIRAFAELFNAPLDDYAIARLAFKIERHDCGLQGGRQDQYSATFGGFNFMEFYDNEHAIINPLRIKNWIICELEASLVLFNTGSSRESARIIADQSRNVSEGLANTLEAMQNIKHEALLMKECLLKGDFPGIVESMRQGWESKKRSASTISTPQIENVYNVAIKAGALSGKVSGAGGGGYMMFFVPPR